MKKKNIFLIGFTLLIFSLNSFSQQKIIVTGKIIDDKNYEIPFAAVGILNKYIGTSSTDEGTFKLVITTNELDDTLKISSIGYDSFKINVRDYLNSKKDKITLNEQFTALDEVVVFSADNYVKNAIKKLKENTLSKNHQLNLLYRRWSVEDNICRFYIEHFINVIDKGPSSYIVDFSVEQVRKSSEYRFVKNEQDRHALNYMQLNNPIRKGINIKEYTWKKLNNSTYDGEDIIIVEGKRKYLNEKLKLFIGYETSKIYKIEISKKPKVGKAFYATYIYKKNIDGKLYLGYHNREWSGSAKFPENVKKTLESQGKKVSMYVPIAYRHEVFVINLKVDKKQFKMNGISENTDMTRFNIPYNQNFWTKISLPPNTNFYNKNIKELESLYGVPIETQFKHSNN